MFLRILQVVLNFQSSHQSYTERMYSLAILAAEAEEVNQEETEAWSGL